MVISTNSSDNGLSNIDIGKSWNSEFTEQGGILDQKYWQTPSIAGGMNVSFGGTGVGSRYLNIDSGININAACTILSRLMFKLPSRLRVGISMSQRIANCDAFIDIVQVNPVNGQVLVDTTLSPFTDGDGAACGFITQFTGTGATNGIQTIRGKSNGGVAMPEFKSASAVIIPTTVATGTTPNFIHSGGLDIIATNVRVNSSSFSINSGINTNFYKFTQQHLDGDGWYALRIRVKNGSTAPASASQVRIHTAHITDSLLDYQLFNGMPDLQNAQPMVIANSPTVLLSNTGNAPSFGATPYKLIGSATTNATLIASGGRNLFTLNISNDTLAKIYVKIYNKASAPTVGTDIPVEVYMVPVGAVRDIDIGYYYGVFYSLGLAMAVTAMQLDADITAVTAGVTVVVRYR